MTPSVANAAASNGSRPPERKTAPARTSANPVHRAKCTTALSRGARASARRVTSAFNALAFSPRWSTANCSVNDRNKSPSETAKRSRQPARLAPAPWPTASGRQSARAQDERGSAHRDLDRAQEQLGRRDFLARKAKLTAALCGLRHAGIVNETEEIWTKRLSPSTLGCRIHDLGNDFQPESRRVDDPVAPSAVVGSPA